MRRTVAAVLLLAVALAPQARAAGPSSQEAYMRYSVGRLLEVRGFLTDALVQYRLAQSLDPGRCGTATAVGRVLLALGRAGEALEPVERARALCPDDADVLAVHAEILLELGSDAEAEAILSEPARADSSPGELVAALSEALVSQGRTEEAEALYAERCRADSLNPVLAFLHARVLVECGRDADAVRELERAERLDPDNRAVTATLGRILVNLGRPLDALPRLERIAVHGAHEEEYAALARAYGALGRHDDAVRLLEIVLAERGETPGLLAALAGAHHLAGDADASVAACLRVIEIEPDSVFALNFVAYTLAEAGRDLDRALAYAERAAALDPESANVRDTLGWVYFRLGRHEEARAELETAIALGASQAVVHEHLGDALAALGLLEQAVASWRVVLGIEPGRASAIARIEAASQGSREAP